MLRSTLPAPKPHPSHPPTYVHVCYSVNQTHTTSVAQNPCFPRCTQAPLEALHSTHPACMHRTASKQAACATAWEKMHMRLPSYPSTHATGAPRPSRLAKGKRKDPSLVHERSQHDTPPEPASGAKSPKVQTQSKHDTHDTHNTEKVQENVLMSKTSSFFDLFHYPPLRKSRKKESRRASKASSQDVLRHHSSSSSNIAVILIHSIFKT